MSFTFVENIIDQKRYDPLLIIIGNLFLDFTNLNHTCPYIGSIIVDGFYLRPQLLTLPLPTGDYMLAMAWYFDKKLQFHTNMSFTYVENIIDQ
ncbi:uncharacterized protein Dwil_GK27478 [Drosophila willistoni]|uniref:Uncharacterized protein n=1 Tax=Drosophila willistoni TaxID=7260 RepID=A0A0Q9X1Q5_DROWI|nr:uncharacterized protein Dwil_GK27478 [Drosophila willistoni]